MVFPPAGVSEYWLSSLNFNHAKMLLQLYDLVDFREKDGIVREGPFKSKKFIALICQCILFTMKSAYQLKEISLSL